MSDPCTYQTFNFPIAVGGLYLECIGQHVSIDSTFSDDAWISGVCENSDGDMDGFLFRTDTYGDTEY
jgi:hypothetical protein